MAQEDYVIADQTGVSFLGDLNNTLAAIVSNNSGATQPSIMYAFQWWYDTNVGVLKLRNAANNAWTTPFADKYDKIGGVLTGQASSTAGDFNLVTNTALSNAAATLTAAQLIGGEFTITPSVARIQTLDTAANIISALSGSVTGSNFTFSIINLAAFDVTIATATGVTLVGNMVVNDGNAIFRVRRLSGSTVSVTRLESGVRSAIFGAGQTVQNMTSSRSVNVNYTNTDPNARMVYVSFTAGVLAPIVNGEALFGGAGLTVPASSRGGCSFSVPKGKIYSISSGATVDKWTEQKI